MTDPRVVRVLIVDDEPLARQRVEDLLRAEEGVEIVASVDNGAAAIDAVRSLQPDLVFLDVQMPGKTGLDVVREVGADEMPPTIFVTAYDRYALQAFELAAVDYLVKPFDDERFEQAFRRARRHVQLEEMGELRERLLAVLDTGPRAPAPATPVPDVAAPSSLGNARGGSPYLERIAVEMRGKVRVVPVSQIEYITASGPYVELHTSERAYLIREAIHTLEERLDPDRFLRIHRSIIVRVDLIDTFHRGAGGDYEVQLKGGARLRVSRSRREELERRLGVTG
ncbi:MAG TPA: LytTR family DNA-binding domain-containing protein [Gemmatimonadaceae bacterium]|nr:LytTR family DNA-binding domain-containing protein [Gemmatimonadaceae bacterium]